jgi:hypothetical protein
MARDVAPLGFRDLSSNSCDPMPAPPAPCGSGKIKEIRITQVDHGYIVNVGCQTFAIESAKRLVKNIEKYFESPEEIEQAWMSKNLEL